MSVTARADDDAVVVPFAGHVPQGPAERVVRRVWLHAQRYAEWLASAPNARRTRGWIPDVDPASTKEFYAQASSVQPINRSIDEIEAAIQRDESRFRYLERLLLLDRAEVDVLHTAAAFALLPDLGAAFQEILRQGERCVPTLDLVARWFGYPLGLGIAADSALRLWDLVREDDDSSGARLLVCDRDVLRWLSGGALLDASLLGAVQSVPARAPLAGWPVDAAVASFHAEAERTLRYIVRGPEGSGRRTFAAAVASRLGCETVAVDTGAVGDAQFPSVFTRVLRLAALERLAVVWHGPKANRPWPRQVPLTPLQFVACDTDEAVAAAPSAADEVIDLPPTTAEERASLWRAYVPSSASWPKDGFEELVMRHRLTPGDIVRIAGFAPEGPEASVHRTKKLQRERLGDLGRFVDCPFTWDDLVVSEKLRTALTDFAFEARDRVSFWQNDDARRLFPRGRGLVGLMTGPPGTGKTMAAQVIARELGADLYRVDLATIVDKYIGETAKNLKRIFAQAARVDAVLLFDEADALFTRRTEVKDAHDRYANADTNYLLQLLEDYSGVALLATNKWSNVDGAFARRLRYLFVFPRPDKNERAAIWRRILDELAADRAPEISRHIEPLAEIFDLSGAQVKNAVLGAIFAARRARSPLSAEHLLVGVERELHKSGRIVTAQERHGVIHGPR